MKGIKALWANYKGAILCLALVGGYCLLRFALGLPCPIKHLSGISCPGCGMTRALWSLVTLDFTAALRYHPAAFVLPVFVILLILFKVKGMKKATATLLAVFVVLMLGIYAWRFATGTGDVVVCEPQSGLIWRFIDYIRSRIS